ncbi:hypothetical protein SAMN05421504_11133 [Amycolatopsis xylanica]|uniref:Uncharacterized protein n=1 Tax=Amycolatopsis xylanica TaxID=589385 RepID=A0A1H3RF98_9PSEU|nr:hypothetical protein [Amycolatopsis xylanica]SDZ23888.1 hypothetical protein SAMN05421504_11133 [Amycolatopsis xylanica]
MPVNENAAASPVRSAGPPVVADGDPGGQTLIVLDPAGLGKHDEVPATWRPFTDQRQILWCRIPAEGALSAAEELLGDADDDSALVVDIVASGPVAEEALRLAARHPPAVRAVMLVDPAWEPDHLARLAKLDEAGVEVRVIAHSRGGELDRVPPPLPLGHPDVVAAVYRTIGELRPTKRS